MSRRRKANQPEKENNERWLITYSDLITLLMIFFVVMYAMSKVDMVKFVSLSQSLSAALKQSDKIPLNSMGSTSLIMPANAQDTGHGTGSTSIAPNKNTAQDQQKLDNLLQQVKQYIQQHHMQGNVTVDSDARGVQITLRDVVLFDTGSAVLKPDAQKLLAGLVPFMQSLDNAIVVEGYTDDQPISTPQYPTNWELSADRAVNVVRLLASKNIDPSRLSGVGYGQYHPVAPNTNDANRQANRRINIVILRKDVQTSSTDTSSSP